MRAVAGLALLILVSACQAPPPPEMTEAEKAQIQTEVLQAAEAWIDSWKDMETDCETITGMMHPDHMALLLGGNVASRDQWLDYCNRTTTNRAGWEGGWTSTEVRPLSADAAVFVGNYTGTYQWLDGSSDSHYANAAQVILFERTATGWGVTFFLNNNGPVERIEEG